jgi:hypothetical protein
VAARPDGSSIESNKHIRPASLVPRNSRQVAPKLSRRCTLAPWDRTNAGGTSLDLTCSAKLRLSLRSSSRGVVGWTIGVVIGRFGSDGSRFLPISTSSLILLGPKRGLLSFSMIPRSCPGTSLPECTVDSVACLLTVRPNANNFAPRRTAWSTNNNLLQSQCAFPEYFRKITNDQGLSLTD